MENGHSLDSNLKICHSVMEATLFEFVLLPVFQKAGGRDELFSWDDIESSDRGFARLRPVLW
jgi:hypothetical protein